MNGKHYFALILLGATTLAGASDPSLSDDEVKALKKSCTLRVMESSPNLLNALQRIDSDWSRHKKIAKFFGNKYFCQEASPDLAVFIATNEWSLHMLQRPAWRSTLSPLETHRQTMQTYRKYYNFLMEHSRSAEPDSRVLRKSATSAPLCDEN